MIRISLLLLSCMFLCISAFCQLGDPNVYASTKRYIPGTPEAMQFQRYGDIPVDYQTGVPQIGMLIYTIRLNDFEWPISLSYHAGGNKVSDIASNVGLGWTLSAGGMVSTKVYGLPDHYSGGPQNDFLRVENLLLPSGSPVPSVTCPTPINSDHVSFATVASSGGLIDCLPDLYYFNFGSFNGKMFRAGGFMPSTELKCENPTDWTDTKGNRYSFTQIGGNRITGTCMGAMGDTMNNFNPNYLLTKIITYTQDTIYFDYSTYTVQYTSGYTENSNQLAMSNSFTTCDLASAPDVGGCHLIENNYQGTEGRLDSIRTSTGERVIFTYQSRSDLPGSYKLSDIKVSNRNNQQIKWTKLQTSYFGTGSDPTDLRLKLDRVENLAENSDIIDATNYYYNGVTLPNRFAKAIDSSGFFNGKISNTSRIPKFSDRSQNLDYAAAGLLQKIEYPTGGFTEFSYELNTHKGGGLRIGSLKAKDPISGIIQNKVFKYFLDPSPYVNLNFSREFEVAIPFHFDYVTYGGGTTYTHTPNLCYYVKYSSEPISSSVYSYFPSDNLYQKVEVYNDSTGATGKEIFEYAYPDFYSYAIFPGLPYLQKSSAHKFENGNYLLISSDEKELKVDIDTSLTYSDLPSMYSIEKRIWGKELTKIRDRAYVSVGIQNGNNVETQCIDEAFEQQSLLLISAPLRQTKNTKKTFSYQGNIVDSIVSTTIYQYAYSNLLSPTEIRTTNSKGDSVVTKLYYPPTASGLTDVSTGEKSVFSTMDGSNFKDLVIGTDLLINNQLQAKSRTIFGSVGSIARPVAVREYPTGGSAVNETTIGGYDALFRPQQFNKNELTYEYLSFHEQTGLAKLKVGGNESVFGAYSDFEGAVGNNWTYVAGGKTSSDQFNGLYSYNLSAGAAYLTLNRSQYLGDYIVSYWYKGTAPQVNSSAGTVKRTLNGWSYAEHTISSSVATISITGTAFIDELKLFPKLGAMQTFSFDSKDQLIALGNSDNSNQLLYQYDNRGRLVTALNEKKEILKTFSYGMANPAYKTAYRSHAVSGSYTRNNCDSGEISWPVEYVLPEGKYSSFISQTDANNMADADTATNGQVYANAKGRCFVPTYFRVTYENIINWGTQTTADPTVRFYADAAGTIPKTVYNLKLYVMHTEPGMPTPQTLLNIFDGNSTFILQSNAVMSEEIWNGTQMQTVYYNYHVLQDISKGAIMIFGL